MNTNIVSPDIYTGLKIPTQRQVIKSLFTTQEKKAERIREIVCKHFNIEVDAILTDCRKRELVLARQLSMWFIKDKTTMSLKAIGGMFGGRDHSTVIYALQTVEDLKDTDRKFARTLVVIDALLSNIHKAADEVQAEVPTVENN